MDTVSIITTAILGQFQAASLIGSVVGGIIGNRSDDFIKSGTKKIFEKLRSNLREPANHDIQRCTRKAYLQATLIAVESCKAAYRWYQVLDQRARGLAQVENYLKQELTKLSSYNVQFDGSVEIDYRLVLSREDAISAGKEEMSRRLKESLLFELTHNGISFEPSLKEAVLNGWQSHGKSVDWFDLMTAFFVEELKTNSRLATIVEQEYLDEISTNLLDVRISIQEIALGNAQLLTYYESLIAQNQLLVTAISNTERKIELLPEALREVVRDELSKTRTVAMPNFEVSERHQRLLREIEQFTKESGELRLEIAQLRSEAENVSPTAKASIGKAILRLEQEQLTIEGKCIQAQNELQDFVVAVIQLAHKLRSSENNSDRLKKAQQLFDQGRYEEIDEVLNTRDIYVDIQEHKQKAFDLSRELLIKARATEISRPDGWFELASKYYQDAVSLVEDFDTCHDLASFMGSNGSFETGVTWFKRSLNYVTNPMEKSGVLYNLARSFIYRNSFGEAERVLNEALVIERELSKQPQIANLFYLAQTLDLLASVYIHKNEFAVARPLLHEAIEIFDKLWGQGIHEDEVREFKSLALNNLGAVYYRTNQFKEAIECLEESLSIREDLSKNGKEVYYRQLADSQTNLSAAQIAILDFENAEKNLYKCLEIRERLAKQNPYKNLYDLSVAHISLSYFFQQRRQLAKAAEMYDTSLVTLRKLVHTDPLAYKPTLALNLVNFANLKHSNNDHATAELFLREALSIYSELSQGNPSAYDADIMNVLINLGNLKAETKIFEEAEQVYIQALDLSRKLAEADRAAYLPDLVRNLHALGALFYNKKDFDAAEPYFTEALLFSKELYSNNLLAFGPYLARVLESMAELNGKQNRLIDANTAYDEAAEIFSNVSDQSNGAYLPNIAHLRFGQGRLFATAGDYATARDSFTKAFTIFRDVGERNGDINILFSFNSLRKLTELYLDHSHFDLAESTILEIATFGKKLIETEEYAGQVRESIVSLNKLLQEKWEARPDEAALERCIRSLTSFNT